MNTARDHSTERLPLPAHTLTAPCGWLNFALLALALLVITLRASAYFVGPPDPLEKLATDAEVIFKGEAVATEAVQDKWFEPVPGYAARETRFKVISMIKGEGEGAGGEVRFRHYDEDRRNQAVVQFYTPQFYHFEPGQIYLVIAHKTAEGARQMLPSHTWKMDLGVLRCRDARPVTAKTLPEIYWAELLALRDSPVPADVTYAIAQWDSMSESPENHGVADFSRIEVLNAVHGLISRPEPEVAQAAIRVVGAGSPYLSDTSAPYWLGTVGVPNPGLGQMDRGTRNAGGALCWRELAAVANSKTASPETRALAIRALGLVKGSDLRQIMDPWLKAPEMPVRAAAMLLYADFATPHPYTTGQFRGFAGDPEPEVRKCAAYAIGFLQDPALVVVLTVLRKDADQLVRRAAMESLHSFRPEIPAVAAALEADLGNPESHPLSLLALARSNPGAHLDELAKVIKEKPNATNSSGGQIPAYTAWSLLFKYLRSRSVAEIRAGKWNRYFPALEDVQHCGESEPAYVYAFYLECGLTEHAAKYRASASKGATPAQDNAFDMIGQNPAAYMGPRP